MAAAYAKELLEYVQPGDMDQERPVKEILNEGKCFRVRPHTDADLIQFSMRCLQSGRTSLR